MGKLFAIALLGLLPSLLSLLLVRRASARWRAQLLRLRSRSLPRSSQPAPLLSFNSSQLVLAGDRSCRFHARSPYLLCTPNPFGPCRGCPHYQPR